MSSAPQMNNRLALRIAVFGGFALALFAILFFRLWFLQVLNGDKYLAEANNNRTREYRVSAPRGEILDRSGRIVVANRTSLALQINPRKLPAEEAERQAELAQLAKLIHTKPHRLRKTLHEQLLVAPSAPVTVRRDVGDYLVYYLEENQDRFPGVGVQRVFVRRYPHGTLAAHILGSVNEINEEQLKEPRFRGLQPGDEIGQEGVEDTYDRFLRGQPGLKKIQVDAFGQPTRKGQLVSTPPVPGDNLKLSIDSAVQEAGEAALAARGLPGGFVTMNVHSGEILGLGSFPSFDPSVFTRPLTQAQVNALYRDPVAAPITDRAIAGLYPTGSTFKLITALAALEGGVITPSSVIEDGGSFTVGGQSFQNAGGASYGALTLVPAIQVSSDVFFYTLGFDMWDTGQLQRWAHKLGIGRPTGIDIPGRRSRPAADQTVARQARRRRAGRRTALVGRRQHPAGDRPGRPADQPAADGDRLRDAGQRRHGRHPARRPRGHRRGRPGAEGIRPQAAPPRQVQTGKPRRDPRRAAPRGAGARRHLLRRLRRLSDPGRGQDRHRAAGRSRRPVLVHRPRPVSQSAYRDGGDDRGRRLRSRIGGPGRAADPGSLFRQAQQRRKRPQRGQPGLMYATRTRRARPEPFALRPGIAERLGLPYMDASLGFAAAGLVAFSVFVLGQATKHDIPGDPNYYLNRQAIYAVLGLVGMYLLARIDYSRFRELRVGIYTFLCVSVSLVFVFGFAARGSRRSFELPLFSFQPSELGKLLLVLALAGFVIDGARRGSPRQRTVRYLALGFAPAALVFLQPDLGTSLVYGAITLAVMYVGGVRWTHFAVIGAALVALVALVIVVAPAIGTPVLKEYQQQRLTSFTHPSADPSDAGYQQNQAKIAIGSGGEDRPGRSGHPDAARLRPRAAHRLHLRGDR